LDTFEEFCQFFKEQEEANSEFLNFHEVIRSNAYQKLRFGPMEFIEQLYPECYFGILPEPVKPEPTGNKVTDCVNEMKYELEVYDTAEHNAIFSETTPGIVKSNMMFKHIMKEICAAFTQEYSFRCLCEDIPFEEITPDDFLIYDSSDDPKFSRHIIIPNVHVSNHLEAKAFADAFVVRLDPSILQVVDLGVYKSTQNFCMLACHKVNSKRVKYLLATNKSIHYSNSLIAYIH